MLWAFLFFTTSCITGMTLYSIRCTHRERIKAMDNEAMRMLEDRHG